MQEIYLHEINLLLRVWIINNNKIIIKMGKSNICYKYEMTTFYF
jgi:hypothetical protein